MESHSFITGSSIGSRSEDLLAGFSSLRTSGDVSSSSYSRLARLHSQVQKLRAEDQHLAKDILEAMEVSRERLAIWRLTTQMRNVFATTRKPVVPSRLGLKATSHAMPLWDKVQ